MGLVVRLALDSAARRCWDSGRLVVGLVAVAVVVVVVVAVALVLGELVAALTVALSRMQTCRPGRIVSTTCDGLAAVRLRSRPRRLLPDVDDALATVEVDERGRCQLVVRSPYSALVQRPWAFAADFVVGLVGSSVGLRKSDGRDKLDELQMEQQEPAVVDDVDGVVADRAVRQICRPWPD